MKSMVAYVVMLMAFTGLITAACVIGPRVIGPAGPSTVIELDSASIKKIVLETDTVAMVEFTYPTCKYCIFAAWIIDSLNKVYGDSMLFAKVNTEKESILWEDFQLIELPTFIFYWHGQEYARRTYHEIMGAGGEYDSLAALTEEVLALTDPAASSQGKRTSGAMTVKWCATTLLHSALALIGCAFFANASDTRSVQAEFDRCISMMEWCERTLYSFEDAVGRIKRALQDLPVASAGKERDNAAILESRVGYYRNRYERASGLADKTRDDLKNVSGSTCPSCVVSAVYLYCRSAETLQVSARQSIKDRPKKP